MQNEEHRLSSPAQVDWLLLSDEDFEDCVEAISTDFGPDFSKMGAEEFKDFCKRRGKYVADRSYSISKLLGNVDLVTRLKEYRSARRAFECSNCDAEELQEYLQETYDPAEKSRASNHH